MLFIFLFWLWFMKAYALATLGAKSFAVGHLTGAQQTTVSGQIITGHTPPTVSIFFCCIYFLQEKKIYYDDVLTGLQMTILVILSYVQ